MKVCFYCRTSTDSFTCILPDERQKLRDFFEAERKKEAEKACEIKRSAPCRK